MGCGSSSESKQGTPSPHYRKPVVNIKAGTNVQKHDTKPRIIFLLGGPGSKKGRLVDDLAQVYGFDLISFEDIIMQELPKKIRITITVENTQDLRNVIAEDPYHLNLRWVLEHLQRRIEADLTKSYIVDVMPNLRWMLRSNHFIKDPSEDMAEFEKKYPVSFAINLVLPHDKVVTNIASAKPCAKNPSEFQKKEPGVQSDEADSTRTQKRAKLYESQVQHWVDFFQKSERIVDLDVTCGDTLAVWEALHDFMTDLGYQPVRTIRSVVLFGFDGNAMPEEECDKFKITKVPLKNIVEDPSASQVQLLNSLSKHMDKMKDSESFVVELEGTSIKKETDEKAGEKYIKFIEIGDNNSVSQSFKSLTRMANTQFRDKTFKAVMSTEDEACIFPQDTELVVCKQIAHNLAQIRAG